MKGGEQTMSGKPYQKIKDAAATTGLSQHYLRQGCRDGTIPAVKSGSTYYIYVPALLWAAENPMDQNKHD